MQLLLFLLPPPPAAETHAEMVVRRAGGTPAFAHTGFNHRSGVGW